MSEQPAASPGDFLGPDGEAGSTPAAPDVPGLPIVKDITVSPDQIVEVAKVIEQQAKILERKVTHKIGSLEIQAPSGDIVSKETAEAWNAVVSAGDDSYRSRVLAYVEGLHSLAVQLRRAGEKYLSGEEDNAAAVREAGGR